MVIVALNVIEGASDIPMLKQEIFTGTNYL